MTKPVTGFIAGQTAQADAWAIAGTVHSPGGEGTAAEKIAALRPGRAQVARHPDENCCPARPETCADCPRRRLDPKNRGAPGYAKRRALQNWLSGRLLASLSPLVETRPHSTPSPPLGPAVYKAWEHSSRRPGLRGERASSSTATALPCS
jgi:hypothetical protein